MSSICRSGEFSGDKFAGGNGCINFGTTTKSLPRTNIAPALFAVPLENQNISKYKEKQHWLNGDTVKCLKGRRILVRFRPYHSSLWQKRVLLDVPEQIFQIHPLHTHVLEQLVADHCCYRIP